MRRLTACWVSLLLLVCVVAAINAAPQASADDCPVVSQSGICLDDDDSSSSPSAGPSSAPPSDGGDGSGCHNSSGETVPCVNEYGFIWIAAYDCYGVLLDPQPPPESPVWRGNDPAKGNMWSCMPEGVTGGTGFYVYIPNGEQQPVDATAVANGLLVRAPFEVAQVHTAPGTPNRTYVGLANWLWIPAEQWHDVTVSATVRGATVTLTAAPTRVTWDPGDGTPGINCTDPGREWVEGMTDAETTTCSYPYDRVSTVDSNGGYDTDRAFTVTGGLFYEVTWTCTGNCSATGGDLGEHPAPTGTADLIVTERQSVVVGRSSPG